MCSISLITSLIDFILISMNTVSFAISHKPTIKENTMNNSWIANNRRNNYTVVAFCAGVRTDNLPAGFLFHNYLLLFLALFFLGGGHNRGSHFLPFSVHSPK